MSFAPAVTPRAWQRRALAAMAGWSEGSFLVSAAPGAGKTVPALLFARAELEAGRARSLALLAPLDEADLTRQISPLMSPLVWDLAHIGNYEELWLLRAVAGVPALRPEIDSLYDAFEHPRSERPSLPILGLADARAYLSGVRSHVHDFLDRTPL